MKRFLLAFLIFSMMITTALALSSCKGTPPTSTTTAATTTYPLTSDPNHACTTTAPSTTEAPATTADPTQTTVPVTTTAPVTTTVKDPYGNDNNGSIGDIW